MSDLLLAAGAILRDQGTLDLREELKERVWAEVYERSRAQVEQLESGDSIMICSSGHHDPDDEELMDEISHRLEAEEELLKGPAGSSSGAAAGNAGRKHDEKRENSSPSSSSRAGESIESDTVPYIYYPWRRENDPRLQQEMRARRPDNAQRKIFYLAFLNDADWEISGGLAFDPEGESRPELRADPDLYCFKTVVPKGKRLSMMRRGDDRSPPPDLRALKIFVSGQCVGRMRDLDNWSAGPLYDDLNNDKYFWGKNKIQYLWGGLGKAPHRSALRVQFKVWLSWETDGAGALGFREFGPELPERVEGVKRPWHPQVRAVNCVGVRLVALREMAKRFRFHWGDDDEQDRHQYASCLLLFSMDEGGGCDPPSDGCARIDGKTVALD